MSATDRPGEAPRELPHDPRHEERILELLCGDRAADDAEVRELLRTCPSCRASWRELEETRARLDGAAEERREVLAELGRGTPAAGEERLLDTLQDLAAREPHARRGPLRPGWMVAAAAVLLTGAWAGWRLFRPAEAPRAPTWLGAHGLELLEPRGEVSEYCRFAWTYDGDATAFTLRIFAEEDGRPGALLFEKEGWKDTTWTPAAEGLARLPAHIHWEVDALDEFRAALDSASASASRSSR